MKDLKKRKDGEFQSPVDRTLQKIKASGKTMRERDITARQRITLSTRKLATFDEKKGWCLTKEGKKRVRLSENTTAYDVVLNTLMESIGNNLLLLDIDKTLVDAKNIFIYRNHPSDSVEVKLTPEEFAKDPLAHKSENKKYYDFREFRDPDKVYDSIKEHGVPIIGNLKIMDNYIKNGWNIGILTARGMEDKVHQTMLDWLMYRNENGELVNIDEKILPRDLVFAINDETKNYEGESDFERKANVMKKLSDRYDRVYLIDDDGKNVKAVNDLAKQKKNIHAMQAKLESRIEKNVNNLLKEMY